MKLVGIKELETIKWICSSQWRTECPVATLMVFPSRLLPMTRFWMHQNPRDNVCDQFLLNVLKINNDWNYSLFKLQSEQIEDDESTVYYFTRQHARQIIFARSTEVCGISHEEWRFQFISTILFCSTKYLPVDNNKVFCVGVLVYECFFRAFLLTISKYRHCYDCCKLFCSQFVSIRFQKL